MSILGNQTRYQDAPYFEAVGDGTTLSYALPWQAGYPGALIVVVGGVPQPVSAYSINGYNIAFSSAPGNGARILVFGRGIRGVVNQPAAGSVTSDRLDQSGLVLPATATVASNPATGLRSTALATMQKFADEFGSSLASSGYQKLPSGLIIQWGEILISGGGSGNALTFPMAFPSSVYSFVASATQSSTSITSAWFDYLTASGARVRTNGVNPTSIRWIAIGK